ncbi:MAG: hypothetical protein ED559_00065 [Phycisphaera sp.]|nr:MAG: hypothetical protein ED559_00065 [Phycisphaera sp.]
MRLLFHPILRWLIPPAAILFIVIGTINTDRPRRGLIMSVAAPVVRANPRMYDWFGSEHILFYVDVDQTLQAAKIESGFASSALNWNTVVAVFTMHNGRERRFGLFYSPIVMKSYGTKLQWVSKGEYAAEDLENTISKYRQVWTSPETATAHEATLFNRSELDLTSVITSNPAITSKPNKVLIIDPIHLLGELWFLLLLPRWLFTLIYARKLWPKHDSSRCPACNYPTLNLPTSTCPECGTALPSPREP